MPHPLVVNVHASKKEDLQALGDQYEYVGRPTKWGNQFSHLEKDTLAKFKVATREEAVERYRELLWQRIKDGEINIRDLAALDGKTLGCWCAPKLCHAEILVAAAEWAHRVVEQHDWKGTP